MASPWNNRLILNLSQVKRSVLKIQMLQDYRSLNKNTAPPSCSFLSKTARPPSQFGSLPPAPRTTDPQLPVLEGRGGFSTPSFCSLRSKTAQQPPFFFFFFLRQVWKKKKRGLFIKKRFHGYAIEPAVAAFERSFVYIYRHIYIYKTYKCKHLNENKAAEQKIKIILERW